MPFSFARNAAAACLPLLAVLSFALAATACQTAAKPQEIPDNTSPAKFFLLVQERMDSDDYQTALAYLQEFRVRFGANTTNDMLDRFLEADYMTAQINYKLGKLEEARAMFAALLNNYQGVPDNASSPPRWIKVLCLKQIDKIDQKINKNKPQASPAASPSASPSPPAASAAPSPSPAPAGK